MPSSSLFDNGRIRKRKVRRKEGTLPFEEIYFLPINMWDLLVYFYSNNVPFGRLRVHSITYPVASTLPFEAILLSKGISFLIFLILKNEKS